MMYSIEPSNQIFFKDYRFLSYCKFVGRNIVKKIRNIDNNIAKNSCVKYNHKFLDTTKNMQQMHLK